MEDHKKIQNEIELAIEHNETNPSSSSPTPVPVTKEDEKPPPETLRERLSNIIHSHKFQLGVIVLVVIDCLLVIAELLFDLEIVHLGSDWEVVPEILHFLSIGILSIFLIEIGIRFYVLRLEFFKHKLEVFDAIVVIISFVLDIIYSKREDATNGSGLLIILRLWRVARIINGIVLSVKKQAEEKIAHEKQIRETQDVNLEKYSIYCNALEVEIASLEDILRSHDIEVPPITRPKLDLQLIPETTEDSTNLGN